MLPGVERIPLGVALLAKNLPPYSSAAMLRPIAFLLINQADYGADRVGLA